MRKPINYNFSNLNKDVINILLTRLNINDDFKLLPFLGSGCNIKTVNFQSKTTEKAVIWINNRYLFIKKIPWYCTDEQKIKFIYKNWASLSKIKYPCPTLLADSNENVVIKIENNYYICYEYIDGYEFDNSEDQCYSIGKHLAAFHNRSLECEIEPNLKSNIYETFYSMISPNTNLDNLNEIIEYTKKQYESINNYDKYVCVVHGDFSPSNVVFNADKKLKAVFDFDDLHYDNPVVDIAEAVASFSIVKYNKNTSNYKNIFEHINKKNCIAILRGYKSHINDHDFFNYAIERLPFFIRIMLSLFYVLSFPKKNKLDTSGFNIEKIDLDFLLNFNKD